MTRRDSLLVFAGFWLLMAAWVALFIWPLYASIGWGVALFLLMLYAAIFVWPEQGAAE